MLKIDDVLQEVKALIPTLIPRDADYSDGLQSRQVRALAAVLVEGMNNELQELEARMGVALQQLRMGIATHGHVAFQRYGSGGISGEGH